MASSDDIPCEKGNSKPKKECMVCKEPAQGNNFGALVCLPCKSFYIRCSKEDVIYSKCHGNCDITGENRIRCQYCRYQQCLKVGMKPREKPERYLFAFDESLCMVCGDLSNGIHFGVNTCEGCKKFFRRCLLENSKLICVNERRCRINPKTRNRCRLCRYLKCLHVGMSKSAVKIGRPKKSRKLQKFKRKPNSINAAYEDWVHNLLNDVKCHSPNPIERDQWISTINSCRLTSDGAIRKSVSPSMENQECSPVQLTRTLPPDVTNSTPHLHDYTASGDRSQCYLNGNNNELHNLSQESTLSNRSLSSTPRSSVPSIGRIKMQDYDSWPLPRQRVHYLPQQAMHTAITHQAPKESVPTKHCQNLYISEQQNLKTLSNDFSGLRQVHVNTTSTNFEEHGIPNQIYTIPISNCGNDVDKDQYLLNPSHYSYGFQYSHTVDDDLIDLLENSKKSTFESLAKAKSTSNIVSEAHHAAQNEIDERSFWNFPEENLTQLYKSAEFLSLPNLTQLSSKTTSKQSDVQVTDLSTPEFDSSDFIYDYTLI